jgi:hypothetical protein
MIINYGLETGECSIFGKELTDSTLIRIGIGSFLFAGHVEIDLIVNQANEFITPKRI